TPLVGREREVALVLERWEAAVEGTGQVVLLSGEAGIGKTRITQTVFERLMDAPHPRPDGPWSPFRQHSPTPVGVGLLPRGIVFRRDDTPEMLAQRLERTVAEIGLPLVEAVPLLASLLGLPTAGDSPVFAWAPERRRQRTIEIVLDV